MAVNLVAPDPATLRPVAGIELGAAAAGIRKNGRPDVLLMRLAPGTRIAGVFTQNSFAAAPVQLCRQHLAGGHAMRALLVNAGNANCGTGAAGLQAAQRSCQAVAALLGCSAEEVLPFSTGVILEPLPVDRIEQALPKALAAAGSSAQHWADAAAAIMTTDTVAKARSASCQLHGRTVSISGIAKGVGMLQPNMATMLAYLATDAALSQAALQRMVRRVADHSFNRVTVDGDTSTNDSFIVMATGQSPVRIQNKSDPSYSAFREGLISLSRQLAKMIVRDGEGATKFMTIRIKGGRNSAECKRIAKSIAHSPLVKTAFFASDPNLGRILAAIGYAGVDDLDSTKVQLWLGDVWVAKDGGRNPEYKEADGQAVMKQAEITVTVDLGRGSVEETVWTCDLSHEYVSINADYRS